MTDRNGSHSGHTPSYIPGLQSCAETLGTIVQQLTLIDEMAGGVFTSTLVGLLVLRADNVLVYANDMAVRMLGGDRKDILGPIRWQDGWTILDAERRILSEETNPARVVMRSGQPLQRQVVGLCLGDRTEPSHWLSVDVEPLRAPGAQESCGAVVSLLDITREKNALDEIKKTQQRYRSYMENAPYGVFICDIHGRYQEVNEAACQITGYGREELTSMSIGDLIPPELRDLGAAHFRRVVEQGRSTGESPFLHKDGRLRWWMVDAVKLSEERFLGFTRDITPQREADLALKTSENRYRQLFDTMKNGVAVYQAVNDGDDFVFVDLNSYGEAVTHRTRDEVVGLSITRVFPNVPDMGLLDVLREVYRTGTPGYLPMTHYEDDRVSQWVENHVYRLDEGLVVAVFEDATQRVQAQQDRDRMEEQLRQSQKMEAVGRLAGGIAHDFNNLLTGISGNVSLALMDLDPDSATAELLRDVEQAAQRAAELTAQLLAFGRKQIIAPKVVDLNDLLLDLRRLLERTIGEDIEIRWALSRDLGLVLVDPGKLEQAVLNLVVNARDAMGQGGKLTVETLNIDLDEAYLQQHPHATAGPHVMLAVSDDGCGIDKGHIDKIFEPFFTTKAEGSGLGLPTTFGIVKQHGGSIEVYSEPGQGTTFKIYLPRVAQEGDAPWRRAVAQPVQADGRETVLVVEDEDLVRIVAVKILARRGYTVYSASNGREALALLDADPLPVDLLLTDVVMPDMNGRDLAAQVVRRNPGVKVLYTSGYTQNVIAHHGVLDEGVAFIAKPYTPAELTAKVREVLDDDGQTGK